MKDFILNIQVLYVLVKTVLIGSIGLAYLGYIDYTIFNYILIGVNVLLLSKIYDEFEAFMVLRIIKKAEVMTVDVTRLLYQMYMNDNSFGGVITKYIIEFPLMLFFAYHGYIFTTIVWIYLLVIDAIIRDDIVHILTTKTIVDDPVDDKEKSNV